LSSNYIMNLEQYELAKHEVQVALATIVDDLSPNANQVLQAVEALWLESEEYIHDQLDIEQELEEIEN